MAEMFLIATSEANDPQHNAVQAIVKAHARGWWHRVPDVWVVNGHDAAYWRDLIRPVLLLSKAKVVVFQLPPQGGPRNWAIAGLPTGAANWLFTSYTHIEIPDNQKVPTLPSLPAPKLPKPAK